MTAAIISFRTGHSVQPAHVAILAEVLYRDSCRCACCRAPGGEQVLYRQWDGPECYDAYIVIDWGEAFDAITGQSLGAVPDEMLPQSGNARIVLDLAYLDHDPGNVGRRGRRPNVVVMCQRCAKRHAEEAIYQRWAR
jgi:hypothetical protein